MGVTVDRATDGWQRQDAYSIGGRTLGRLPAADARRVIFLTRLPFLVFPLGIVYLVWLWGRQLFRDSVALGLAACAALEPTILGHGALIKSDVAAAFGALAFAYAAWRYWMGPDARRLGWMTAALIAAVLTKFNLLLLVLPAIVLVLVRDRRRAYALLPPVAVYLAIIAAYQFHAGPIEPEESGLFIPAGVPDVWRTSNLVRHLPWPRQFVRGLLFVGGAMHNGDFRGWMLGHRIEGAAPGYYPLAWAIKFPIPLQVLTAAALAALLARLRRREACAADAFLWGFAVWYFGTAVVSDYHIGFRHALPALPFLVLAGGFALERWGTLRAGRWVAAALFVWLAVTSLRVYPQGISYFNEWIGGPVNGWHYLADSNIDWGQNLPELGAWRARHPGTRLRLYVFGLDEVGHYLPPRSWEPMPAPWSANTKLDRRLQPDPGIYAVSVNMLVGLPFERGWEHYLAFFRDRQPIDRAGYSILIYEVN
jgi:hypothetical protein